MAEPLDFNVFVPVKKASSFSINVELQSFLCLLKPYRPHDWCSGFHGD